MISFEMKKETRTGVVYRAWDIDGNLLYVGSTVDFEQRMVQHSYQSLWFPYAARIAHDAPQPIREARRSEGDAIRRELPWFNVNKGDKRQVDRWREAFRSEFKRQTGVNCYGWDSPADSDQGRRYPSVFWAARRFADETEGICRDTQWRHGCYLAFITQASECAA